MNGFSKHSSAFLKALSTNNNRDWFAQNKSSYETLSSLLYFADNPDAYEVKGPC